MKLIEFIKICVVILKNYLHLIQESM